MSISLAARMSPQPASMASAIAASAAFFCAVVAIASGRLAAGRARPYPPSRRGCRRVMSALVSMAPILCPEAACLAPDPAEGNARGVASALRRLPQFDRIAVRIGKVGKAAIRLRLRMELYSDAGLFELRDHGVEIPDPEIDHPLTRGVAKIVGVGGKWREDRRPGLLLPGGVS
jgi:hypothetical protein